MDNVYIIYCTYSDDSTDSYEVYGIGRLARELRLLSENGVKRLQVYKRGKNFENDQDDIIPVYKNRWRYE